MRYQNSFFFLLMCCVKSNPLELNFPLKAPSDYSKRRFVGRRKMRQIQLVRFIFHGHVWNWNSWTMSCVHLLTTKILSPSCVTGSPGSCPQPQGSSFYLTLLAVSFLFPTSLTFFVMRFLSYFDSIKKIWKIL